MAGKSLEMEQDINKEIYMFELRKYAFDYWEVMIKCSDTKENKKILLDYLKINNRFLEKDIMDILEDQRINSFKLSRKGYLKEIKIQIEHYLSKPNNFKPFLPGFNNVLQREEDDEKSSFVNDLAPSIQEKQSNINQTITHKPNLTNEDSENKKKQHRRQKSLRD